MEKILYITYDFNFKKTASSRFFYDFLCENFNVETISPQNETVPYDEINIKNYDCIISFYFMADFSKFTCKNLIFVPMYDGFSFSFKKVLQLRNVKIINFCKYLHKLSKLFGLNSVYLQYYPELQLNKESQRNLLFYWQRRETPFATFDKCFFYNIDYYNIKKTILHSTNDGVGTVFVKPNDDIMKKFNITITEWFEKKSDLEELLDKTLYYIAPRKQEGIGLSFLDAMSRGCVIIAHNDRTMNEYIKNGNNGYLIDFDNPKQINFMDYKSIQNKSIKSVIDGRKKYLKTLPNIITFIKRKKIFYNYMGLISSFIFFSLKKLSK